ncbi:MAG: hybrid sensor histidine kinase/response regulator [Ignavibacteria bacterium]|nr:MAG: hybrid sensor histidine kinase/response regulator [Ignavibacteria bacterium]
MVKIAVIEDEVIVRETIVERLSEAGYHVISAENGLLGIDVIREHRPDLVLCDIMMPNLGGFGVLEYIRKDPETALVPFIFLSALSDKSDLRKGMLSGADDYLTKPFTRDELLNAVKVRLEKRQSFHNNIRSTLEDFRDSLSRSLPHEFLTPLNSILGLSNLLRDHKQEFDDTDVNEMLTNIHQSGQRLLRLVQNYLRFAELESIRHDDERRNALLSEEFEFPQSVIEETIERIAEQTGRHDDINVTADAAPVRMNPANFEKIIEELADNACKFSLDGTQVAVNGKALNGYYEVSVMDRGRGVSQQQIEAIGAYRQFDRTEHEQRGVGLGLAIVHSLVDLHGGTMRIESEPGKYTAVTLLIPLSENPRE